MLRIKPAIRLRKALLLMGALHSLLFPGLVNAQFSEAVLKPSVQDLAYADKSPAEKLDLYLPASRRAEAPVVIWMHGGGFRLGDKRSMPRRYFGPPPKPIGFDGPYQIQVPDVAALNAKGYAVVSLNYRLGLGLVPAVQDGKAAVRFLRANAGKYRLDPAKVAVWGNSAGGIMASLLGVTGDQQSIFDDPGLGNVHVSSAVQAVVVWFGASDREVGPYLSNAKVIPPFMIANGDFDRNISSQMARQLHDALIKAGVDSTLTILRGAGHEDPAFMATQMLPTIAFLEKSFARPE